MNSRVVLLTMVLVIMGYVVPVHARNAGVFLNAFSETATAYVNDSFLLLGTTADGFVAHIIPKEKALDIVTNVQKRIRRIRGKLKLVTEIRLADVDLQLISLLDATYGCLDHLAWTLSQYIEERSPETAQRFENHRRECVSRIEKLRQFYSTLPPAEELPEPLSTR